MNSARWLIPFGILLLAAGIAAFIGAGNEDVVNWLKDNATCNERPCTYEEAEGILTGIGVIGSVAGGGMLALGIWQLSRSGERGPPVLEAEATGSDAFERLARLDAMLAEGGLEVEDYRRRRERILREL